MNAAIWTLWLISWVPSISTAATAESPAVVTPLATYPTQTECYTAIDLVREQLKKQWQTTQPSPGLMICVYGTPIKK